MIGRTLFVGAAVLGTAYGVRSLVRSMRAFDYNDKVVLISGGSRGLGLVMARQLVAEGAKVALIARNEEKLQGAVAELEGLGGEAFEYSCDIRDQSQADNAVLAVMRRFGPIDVLINDAGIISVGPMDTLTVEDYKESMDTHFWGPLYLTMAVLPHMRLRKFGRIVNISSIGGRIAVPHLLAYSASKFALVGFSEGLRAELLKDNIFVTTVCPGMMRTGSHINATFKGNTKQEYSWFSISNALPISSISAERAAQQILRATKRGDAELIISIQAQTAIKFANVFPGITQDIAGVANAFMPKANSTQKQKKLGRESQSWLAPSILTALSDSQSPVNNEV